MSRTVPPTAVATACHGSDDPVAGLCDHDLPPPGPTLRRRDRPSAGPLLEPAVGEHAVECDGAVDVLLVAERPWHVLGAESFEIGDGQCLGVWQAGDDQLAGRDGDGDGSGNGCGAPVQAATVASQASIATFAPSSPGRLRSACLVDVGEVVVADRVGCMRGWSSARRVECRAGESRARRAALPPPTSCDRYRSVNPQVRR